MVLTILETYDDVFYAQGRPDLVCKFFGLQIVFQFIGILVLLATKDPNVFVFSVLSSSVLTYIIKSIYLRSHPLPETGRSIWQPKIDLPFLAIAFLMAIGLMLQ
jgi:hypothetical protein